jgi:hypothetical protein
MPVPPNTDNYTVPGGQKIYFNNGSGERPLGNIVELDLNHVIENLEHWSNQSGDLKLDKIVPTTRKIEFSFKLDEPVLENLRMFFAGGAVENLGENPAVSVADIQAILTGIGFKSLGQYYGLSSVVVRQFLDKCFVSDGAVFTDHSVEVDSLAGTPFITLEDADSELYLGKDTKFKEAYFDLATPGVYGAVVVEYWNGSAWVAVTGLAGAAAALAADGKMQWDLPVDWAKTIVNGYSAYYLRITATTPWTTPATINCIRQNAVVLVDYQVDFGQAGTLDRVDGKIARIAAGMLVDGEAVKVSFNHTTWTAQQFALSMTGFIEGSARIEIFPSSGLGARKEYIIPKCQIKPNGNVKEDAKAFEEIPFTLSILSDHANNPTFPYGRLVVYED